MSFLTYFQSLKQPEQRLAWAVAIAADALQIAAFPLFVEGGISPADSLLDLIVAFVLITGLSCQLSQPNSFPAQIFFPPGPRPYGSSPANR